MSAGMRPRTVVLGLLVGIVVSTGGPICRIDAAELTKAVDLFRTGQYAECAVLCQEAIDAGEFSETWRILKIQAECSRGDYPAADQTLAQALERFSTSVRLRWLGATVARMMNDESRAQRFLKEMDELVASAAWRYSDPPSRVTLGRFYLHRGVDAKQVLAATFSYVKKSQPDYAESYVAAGQLALEKHDYALAAEEFQKALKLDATDPDIHLGLARAYESSDDEKATLHLQSALERNPRHVDSLLFSATSQIGAEYFDRAEETLGKVFEVNPLEPRAWALKAVLAHLNNHHRDETIAREMGLAWWPQNPLVDHLIGVQLSQKYRFKEGAACQRRALAFAPDFQPARIQLSQDLLRLGEEDEGWKLASQVFASDNYQIVAHNLSTLRDHLKTFRTLEADGFVVRMDAREADVYGTQVLELLANARRSLGEKYQVKLDRPVLVEIFAEQQDFAIRTFGLPGGAGFLGVCFGNVITANSPASQGETPSNWQAVLWHEFCHVVTLNKTQNRMPRWLSEGISVYEELQANPQWGQGMTPRYREMILGPELTPVSQLSGAFLHAPSPEHLQFAYFQSAMVVEFLVDRYGLDTLRRILTDLAVGMPINEALGRSCGSIGEVDLEFAKFARQRAEKFGAEVDWTTPSLSRTPTVEEVAQWVRDHPKNYAGLKIWAEMLLAEEKWSEAKEPLERLRALLPNDRGTNSAARQLATVYRQLGDLVAEKQALEEWTRASSDALPAFQRLMEMASADSEWTAVERFGESAVAVHPLQPSVQRSLAMAAEKTGNPKVAIRALRALLVLSPAEQADVHYRLACLLQQQGELVEAKRHILLALEEAPRFRAGHAKLLEIVKRLETTK